MGELIRFIRHNDLPTIWRVFNSREAHPAMQFVKYGLCGVTALTLHTVIFLLCCRYVIPGLESNCPDDYQRALASLPNNGIAFLFSNMLVYWLNTKWVFQQGRHGVLKEFFFFSLVNLPGVLCGGLVQFWITKVLGWPTIVAIGGFVLPSVLINFACRKFFIFKK